MNNQYVKLIKQILLEVADRNEVMKFAYKTYTGNLLLIDKNHKINEEKVKKLINEISEKLIYKVNEAKRNEQIFPEFKKPNTEHRDLISICNFYLQLVSSGKSHWETLDVGKLEDVLDTYGKYIVSPKAYGRKLLAKYSNISGARFSKNTVDFVHFKKEVDANFESVNVKQLGWKGLPDPIFENDKIVIFYGENRKKAILYGQGKKTTLCTARQDASNMFGHYRFEKEGSIYYVYFKQPKDYAKMGFVDISLYPDEITINFVTDNTDRRTSKEKILKQIPELAEEDENGNIIFDKYIVPVPLDKKEKQLYNKIQNTESILELKDYAEQEMFIEFGKEIEDDEWDKLENKEELLQKYIEVGEYDIPDKFEHEYPKLWARYIKRLHKRVSIKIEDDDFHFSRHEIIYVVKDNKEIIKNIALSVNDANDFAFAVNYGQDFKVPEEIIQKIAQNVEYSFYYAKRLEFKDVPPEIIQGIAKDADDSFLYAKELGFKDVPPEIIQGIAKNAYKSFLYAKALGFKDVPKPIIDAILNSEYKNKLPQDYTVAKESDVKEESFSRKLKKLYNL